MTNTTVDIEQNEFHLLACMMIDKSIAKYILENDDPDLINSSNGVMQLFGWQSTAGHKWAWCPETLAWELHKAGFKDLEAGGGHFHNNPERDFLIVGIK